MLKKSDAGMQRILKVEYEFPAHVKVSKECRDLLSHILVPDPANRITIPEIQRHPWYCKDLPPGVAEMNDNLPVPTTGIQVCTSHAVTSHDNLCELLASLSIQRMPSSQGPLLTFLLLALTSA